LEQRSLIDFCIVSNDLFQSALDVRVKTGAELSTDHHLAGLQLASGKAAMAYTRAGPGDPTE